MPAPNLGYGKQSEATIDQVNIWMRSTPWYQQQMRSWGQDPGHPHLTKDQSAQILRTAQANGVVVDQGAMEVDDGGNFNPKGHKLRNTLIVAGVAAATIATMGAAGVFSGGGAAAGGATGASGTAAAGVAGTGATTGVGASLAGAAAAAGAHGLSYGELLKYGLPVAGNLIGGVIQAKAAGAANDAQQKYLEEALAYEKEKDLYARTTDAARYADSRGDLAESRAKEEGRYAGYQGRIAPWIANGTSSNDRMAALLGLPPRAGGASGGGFASSRADDTRSIDVGDAPQQFYAAMQASGLNPVAVQGHGQQIADAINRKYPGLGATVDPTTDAVVWPGLGPIDVTVDSGKGGWSFRPSGRYTPTATPAPATSTSAARVPTAPAPGSPQSAPAVQMKAPDGSVRTIPADQVDHYTKLGATRIGAAA